MMRRQNLNSSAGRGGPSLGDRFLIAVDVDGTLLNTEYEDQLRPREREAVLAALQAGHVVALCTGRNSRSVAALLARSGDGLNDLPLILLNGAVVIGGTPRRRLCHYVLGQDLLRRIVTIFRQHNAVPMIYDTEDRGGMLYHENRPTNSVLSRYLARRLQTVGAIVTVDDILAQLPASALEVGTIDQQAKIETLTAQIRHELAESVSVINTESLLSRRAYRWAEVYHRDCSKGQGALLLADAHAIARNNIVAVGDNYNDLDLFAVASLSIAMGNAPADVQAAADCIALPVTESGAAVVLEQIAAGQLPCRKQ